MTVFVNVPMNEELASPPARRRASWRARGPRTIGPWDFWNGVRTVFSILAFLALVGACLLREGRGTDLNFREFLFHALR